MDSPKPVGMLGRYEEEIYRQYADQAKCVESPLRENDSREKVEADLNAMLHALVRAARRCGNISFTWVNDPFLNLLDRIQLITAKEFSLCCTHMPADPHEITVFGMSLEQVLQLKKDIENYEHDCDLLWEEKKALAAERDRWREKAHAQAEQLAQVQDALRKRNCELKPRWEQKLKAAEHERDRWRDLCGRMLDAAHEIERVGEEVRYGG